MAPSAAGGEHGEGASPSAVPPSSFSSPPPNGIHMPLKQKMAVGFKSLFEGAKKLAIGDTAAESPAARASMADLFPKVDPAVDGEDCDHDCESCVVKYPKGFKIDEADALYGFVKGWSTHVLVATGKSDWVRDVTDEKGSVMQAIGNAKGPSNGVGAVLFLPFRLTCSCQGRCARSTILGLPSYSSPPP